LAGCPCARAEPKAQARPLTSFSDAARTLGEQQSTLIAGLPDRPNERLVYSCANKP